MEVFYKPGSFFEMYAGYDNDLSQIHYDFFVEDNNVITMGDRQKDFMIVSPNVDPNDDTMFSKAELRKMSAEEVTQLHADLELSYYGAYYDPNKEQMIDDLVNVTVAEYYKKLYTNERWYDLPYDVISRGFCQGDAVAVVFHKCRHMDVETIDNILWRSPITIRLTDHESGEEWHIEEDMDTPYEYDRDELLEAWKPHLPEAAYEFLEEKLPSNLYS